MKKLFTIFAFVTITLLLASSVEAAPQQSCGQVVSIVFRTAANGLAYTAISLTGMPGNTPSMVQTNEREIGKIALLLKMTGDTACILYDTTLPAENNIIQLQPM